MAEYIHEPRNDIGVFATPGPKRGRPPVYATEEERHEARKASKRKWAKNRTPEQREKARKATADWRAKKAAEAEAESG